MRLMLFILIGFCLLSPVALASRLSDEFKFTRYAYPQERSIIREKPEPSSRAVGRLRYYTEEGNPEIYLALESRLDGRGKEWVKTRIPGRPNGRVGWVKREILGNYHLTRKAIRINKQDLKLTVYNRGRAVWSTRVGVGKSSTPTPSGHFYIRQRIRNLNGSPIYGPLAFGTSAYAPKLTEWPGGGVVGIHGTNQPGLLPGRVSNGCIRLRNSKILELGKRVGIGVPIRIF